jgi:hypothetical protein
MFAFESVPMNCASLGTPNAIPDIRGFSRSNPPPAVGDPGMPEEEGAWVHQGHIHTVLPYTMIDGYDRNPKPSSLRMAVLENEHLRAEFAMMIQMIFLSLTKRLETKKTVYFRFYLSSSSVAPCYYLTMCI